MSTQIEDFVYVNLQDIDPNFSTLPSNNYTLQVQKAELKEFTYRNGSKAGTQGTRVAFQFVVVDDADYSGRKVYESMFPSTFSFKALRRLADATGTPQDAGEPLADWLTKLANEQVKFNIFVDQVEDLDKDGNARSTDFKGNPAKVNRINWKEVRPA